MSGQNRFLNSVDIDAIYRDQVGLSVSGRTKLYYVRVEVFLMAVDT